MKLWTLVKTEYEGQCTGFDHFDTLIVVFEEKPDIQTIAPFLRGLSNEIGEAISQIASLLKTGDLQTSTFEQYTLACIETGKRLA